MKRCALYRHYDEENSLLYVGVTTRPYVRFAEHVASSHWADDIHHTAYEWFEDFASAFNAERAAIFREDPLHNKHGKIKPDCQEPTAEKVRALRIAANCTQSEFAERIGVNRAQLGHWETGVQRLSLDGAFALREAFGVSLDWLYPGSTHRAAS